MILTTQQVAEKLKVSENTVRTLANRGELLPVNPKQDGKRTYRRFDSKVVAEFAKTYLPKPGFRGKNAPNSTSSSAPINIIGLRETSARLANIEKMVQAIYNALMG